MPWDRLPVLRYGEGGKRTDIVCGYPHSTDALSARCRPCSSCVRREGPAGAWVRSSVAYALELSSDGASMDATPTRLPELLVTEMLRHHLASAPAVERGWIGALPDPVLAPALARLHAEPERQTVIDLAREASVSRSLLDERFRQVLGSSPIRYLAESRMHIAADLLRSTVLTVAQVARRVGYDAEEAFSRAFKCRSGSAPSVWRRSAGVVEWASGDPNPEPAE